MHQPCTPTRPPHRLHRRAVLLIGAAATLAAVTSTSWAQAGADRPIRLIVPYTPGGSTDLATRIAAQFMGKELGTTVVVENKPGANTVIATQSVASAPADGSTVLIAGTASMTSNPFLYKKLPYDAEKAFAPIGMVSRMPFVMVVNARSKATTVGDFIALGKAAKAPLRYGSAGNGNPTHLAGALFSEGTGVPLQQIPYQGSAPSLSALLAGDTDVNFEVLSTALPHIRGGKLRALAVMASERNPKLPDVPTLAESGVQGLDISTSFAMLVPAATPAAVQQRLHQALMAVTANPAYAKALDEQALQAYPPMTQAATAALFAAERARWKGVIEKNAISLD